MIEYRGPVTVTFIQNLNNIAIKVQFYMNILVMEQPEIGKK